MSEKSDVCLEERWAHLRFSIVGPLLSAPPKDGELKTALEALAEKLWLDPVSGEQTSFSLPPSSAGTTWRATRGPIPSTCCARSRAVTVASQRSLPEKVKEAVGVQYTAHPGWSVQLHFDNLVARAKEDPALSGVPSYSSVKRYLRGKGLVRTRRLRGGKKQTAGQVRAAQRLDTREVRSYEVEHVGGLWHLDFHNGSLKVLLPKGEWAIPVMLGILDDRSRLACHVQWYLREATRDSSTASRRAPSSAAFPAAS